MHLDKTKQRAYFARDVSSEFSRIIIV